MKRLFLSVEIKRMNMKKFAVAVILSFVIVLLASSCNKQTCPAYSKADVENTGHNG